MPPSSDLHGHWNHCKLNPAACDENQIETLQGYSPIHSLTIIIHSWLSSIKSSGIAYITFTSFLADSLVESPALCSAFRFQAWYAFNIESVLQIFKKRRDVHKFMLCSLPEWVTRHMVWRWLTENSKQGTFYLFLKWYLTCTVPVIIWTAVRWGSLVSSLMMLVFISLSICSRVS